jgi:hypothetical protein
MEKAGVIVFLIVFAFIVMLIESCNDTNARIKRIQSTQKVK